MPDVPDDPPALRPAGATTQGESLFTVKILTVALIFILFFTTIGIWMVDAFLFRLDDLQWIILIVVPWSFFILLLTAALVIRIFRGIYFI